MKRILTLCLALVMMLSVLTACGKTEENGGNTDTEQKQEEKKEGESTEKTEKELKITDTFYPQYDAESEYAQMTAKLEKWFYKNLEDGTLFSVKCGADESKTVLARLEKGKVQKTEKDGDTLVTMVYTDSSAKLQYTVDATLFGDFPTVDYTVTIKNIGTENSPVISEFNGIDTSFDMPASKGYTLHTSKGSASAEDDFELVEQAIKKSNEVYTYHPFLGDGRATSGAWPYFDVIGKDCGIMLAIGWTGIWEASFSNTKVGSVNMSAGQYYMNASLFPGETVRSPRIVLTYFDGDFDYGHNVFRKLIIEHYSPEDGSEDRFVSPIALNSWGGIRENFVLKQCDAFFKAGVDFDVLWFDAGWNADHKFENDVTQTCANGSEWAEKRGWYEINPICFPSGSLMKISNFVHSNGAKLMLWWMIEDGMLAYKDKFSIPVSCYYDALNYDGYAKGNISVLNLASDEVLETVLAYFDRMFEQNGLDWVRVDNGSNPQKYWEANDKKVALANKLSSDQRVGMTENKHILNYLKLWDELAARHPGFVLDNCASGGRRLDIEMTKRGIPLWRTDYDCDHNDATEIRQMQTQYISLWIPLSASGVIHAGDSYSYRSFYSSSCCYSIQTVVDELTMSTFKAINDEWKWARPYWYGCFYSLMDINSSSDTWQSYELFREDWQKGMLVTIRRLECDLPTQQISLKGLLEDQTYRIHDIDAANAENDIVKTGKELMNEKLTFAQGERTIKVYEISIVK